MNSRYTIRKECKNLILFLLISFLLPLASVATQTMISNHFICFILYGIQAAAPTISAIIVLCLDKKVKSYFAFEHSIYYYIMGAFGGRDRLAGIFRTMA